jgi:tetratricopeptide (TPR) repeat protein
LADTGELAGALDNYRKALDLRLSVASADPKNQFARNSVVRAYDRIGGILEKMGDREGALDNYKKILGVHEGAGSLPQQAAACAKIADFYSKLATESRPAQRDRTPNLRNAVRWYRRSLELRSRSGEEISDAEGKERQRITQEIARCEAGIH